MEVLSIHLGNERRKGREEEREEGRMGICQVLKRDRAEGTVCADFWQHNSVKKE